MKTNIILFTKKAISACIILFLIVSSSNTLKIVQLESYVDALECNVFV